MASNNLSLLKEIESFNPRLRFYRATRNGMVKTTESLFPNYIFARFDIWTDLDTVQYTPGISQVIHFGRRYPIVDDGEITELRRHFKDDLPKWCGCTLREGDEVTLTEKPFSGMKAVISRVLPAKQRVQVLIELLGRTTQVDLAMHSVSPREKGVLRSFRNLQSEANALESEEEGELVRL